MYIDIFQISLKIIYDDFIVGDIRMKNSLKKIMIIILCFVFTFNSFAAVSVSDGSAFVTKAEFSADLNNLSNRMAQLENSLDAKIDSLVSSYLTRNGIWNGSNQELLWTEWTHSSTVTYSTAMQYIHNSIIVENVNKTGLMYYTGYYYDKSQSASSTSSTGYGMNYRSQGNNAAGSGLYLGIVIASSPVNATSSDKDLTSYTLLSRGLNNQNSNYVTATLALSNQKIPITLIAFVEKNTSLWWRYQLNTKMSNFAWDFQWYNNFKPTYVTESIVVY